MDMDRELTKAKWLFGGLALFAISCYFTYEEGLYFFRGRQTTAKVTNIALVTSYGRSGERKHVQVDFAFVEPNGTQRTGSDTKGADWRPPGDGNVTVQYTPGSDSRARVSGY